MSLVNTIKQAFRNGNMTLRLIYINLAIFIFTALYNLFVPLFFSPGTVFDFSLTHWLGMPAALGELLYKPWTVITYMFVHAGIWHILFNMLWFYWFAQIFSSYYSDRQQLGLYLFGGLWGASFYVLFYNLFPYFSEAVEYAYLVGASASVIAVVVATAVTAPNYKLNLLLIGPVQLKYIALVSIAIDLFSIRSSNAGGHIAHLGGALAGYLFASNIKSGKDITFWIQSLVDRLSNLFSKKSGKARMRVKYRRPRTPNHSRPESDQEYRDRRATNHKEVDRILDKIKRGGYDSLSKEEKRTLFEAGSKS